MMAIESFKKFRIKDTIIILLAGIWALSAFLINKYFDPQYSYMFSLLIAIFLMTFTVYLVRKAGSAMLFFVLGSVISYNLNDIGATGFNKLIVFLIAGIIFEVLFLIFKIEIKNIPMDIILGAVFSAASIPITTSLLLSLEVSIKMIYSLGNMVLISMFIAVMGSILSFLLWYKLRTTKFVLRFEYE